MEIKFANIGNRIESALREWAAAQQTLERQPRTAARAVDRDGFLRVHRARGIELATSAEEDRKKNAVERNAEKKRSARNARSIRRRCYVPATLAAGGSVCSSSFSSEANSAFATDARG